MHLGLGELRQAQGRLREAETEFRTAVREYPSAPTYGVLGTVLTLEGRPEEAVESLRASAARDARPLVQWLMIGRNELAAGRPLRSLEALSHASRANPYAGDAAVLGVPYMAELWATRGKALLALRLPQDALKAFEISWNISPGSQPGDFGATWAEAYRMVGRPGDAERVLRETAQAAESLPDPPPSAR
jgi:tetratricopeptide (TPR) repeat protein